MSSWNGWRAVLLVLIVLGGGKFAARGVLRALDGDTGGDLRSPLVAAAVWAEGGNPYDPQLLSEQSKRLDVTGDFVGFLHPPAVCVVLWPVAQFDWATARPIVGALSILLIIASIPFLLMMAGFRATDAGGLLLIALVLGFAPFASGLSIGNLSVPSACLSIVGLGLMVQRRLLWAGMAAAIATALKPQIGGVLVLYFLGSGQWRTFATALGAYAILFGIGAYGVWTTGVDFQTIKEQWNQTLGGTRMVQGGERFTTAFPDRINLVNLHILLHSFTDNIIWVKRAVLAIVGLGCGLWFFVYWRSRQVPHVLAYGIAVGLSLLAVYHRNYDLPLLLPAIAWCCGQWNGPAKWPARVVAVSSMLFLLPIPGIILTLGVTEKLPALLSDSWFWRCLVLPQNSVVVVLMTASLFAIPFIVGRKQRVPAEQSEREPGRSVSS